MKKPKYSGELLKKKRYFYLNYKEEKYSIVTFKNKEVKSFQIADDTVMVIGTSICSMLVEAPLINASVNLHDENIIPEYIESKDVYEFNFMIYDYDTHGEYNYFMNKDILIEMNFFIFKDEDKVYL